MYRYKTEFWLSFTSHSTFHTSTFNTFLSKSYSNDSIIPTT